MKKTLIVLMTLLLFIIAGCDNKKINNEINNEINDEINENEIKDEYIENFNLSNEEIEAYKKFIEENSFDGEYDESIFYDFIYYDEDDKVELAIGNSSIKINIYKYDFENNEVRLIRECKTGARGATEITYVPHERVTLISSMGMLFESEYNGDMMHNKVVGSAGEGSWGSVYKDDEEIGYWSKSHFLVYHGDIENLSEEEIRNIENGNVKEKVTDENDEYISDGIDRFIENQEAFLQEIDREEILKKLS